MYHGHIDVPTFAYFEFGNTWTGSLLGDFNYRIVPEPKHEPPRLFAAVWHGELCYELSEPSEQLEEDFSAEGYARMIERINTLIDEYMQKVK